MWLFYLILLGFLDQFIAIIRWVYLICCFTPCHPFICPNIPFIYLFIWSSVLPSISGLSISLWFTQLVHSFICLSVHPSSIYCIKIIIVHWLLDTGHGLKYGEIGGHMWCYKESRMRNCKEPFNIVSMISAWY